MIPLTLSQFLGVISTTAAIFSIDSVVAAPRAVAGVVVALLAGLLLIFAIFLKWSRRLVELLTIITTPCWISMERWIRIRLRSSETATEIGPLPSNIPMELFHVLDRNSTVV